MDYFNKYRYVFMIVAVSVLAYEAATDGLGIADPTLFPGLPKVAVALYESRELLFQGILSSLGLLLPSYCLALVVGITGGLTIGWHKTLRENLAPLFHGISPIPPNLYTPYAIALMPTFWLSSTSIIFIGCLWPILMSTIQGVVLIEEKYLDNARTLGLKGFKLLRKIILPAALPLIFSGAGTSLIFSFILLTVAEMFGVKSGLGFFVLYYADFFDYARVLAGMLVMSLLIMCIMGLFSTIQRRMLFWTAKR
ncbi:MAG TPA: ABC transporter permease subunit [Methylomusa anaerophila]|uniref:Bicarbonate transport system permease protein CmpB n=1 Tax=Methylomusa anaerophila TaxID=1930071 RepID=A0A348AHI5_9FIRM|nr:ABC transporter permease subunit [Methylomusa anaerophila]BBB90533.1 bicarbonate transport system permease protein CmpB [Methylomusa anaerophila]HML89827.1 ABC transporter permease subunit [Methylomusa anaerophila]